MDIGPRVDYSLGKRKFYRRSNQASRIKEGSPNFSWKNQFFTCWYLFILPVIISHAFSFIFYLFLFFLWRRRIMPYSVYQYWLCIWFEPFLPLCKLNNISNRKKWIEKLWKISINRTRLRAFRNIYKMKNMDFPM